MKAIRRSDWADGLTLLAAVGLTISMIMPWNNGMEGLDRLDRSQTAFDRSPWVPPSFGDFCQQLLFLSACGLGLVFVAFASQHYAIACYFALFCTASSILYSFYAKPDFGSISGIWIWIASEAILIIANAVAWRKLSRLRRVIENDE
jgi:hypothetical protein